MKLTLIINLKEDTDAEDMNCFFFTILRQSHTKYWACVKETETQKKIIKKIKIIKNNNPPPPHPQMFLMFPEGTERDQWYEMG